MNKILHKTLINNLVQQIHNNNPPQYHNTEGDY